MAITNEFKDAVLNNKLTRVRIMLKDMMLVDPSLTTFNEMIKYAESNMSNLYDIHDGEAFKDISEWDKDYMNQQMVSIIANFSKERVELVKKIVRYIYKEKINTGIKESSKSTTQRQNTERKELTGLQIAGGAVALVGAGAVIGGTVTANIPIAAAGGVAIVGGVALIILGGN